MFQSILIPFLAIAAAEFLDKSQLSILFLSSKTKHHFQLLLGVMTAFLIVDGSAILLGSWITQVISPLYIKLIAGGTFIVFGLLMLRKKPETADKIPSKKSTLFSGFLLVFVSEWGDKTQIAAALFATQYHPFAVTIGVMSAQLVLAILAIYFGKLLSTKLEKLTGKIAGIVFIIVGLLFLIF